MYIVYCISYLFSGYHWVTPLPYFSPVLQSRWSCRSSCSSATSSSVFFLHYLLSENLQHRDHCGLWRLLVATIGITGVVVVARPPGIFPPEVSLTLEIVFGLLSISFVCSGADQCLDRRQLRLPFNGERSTRAGLHRGSLGSCRPASYFNHQHHHQTGGMDLWRFLLTPTSPPRRNMSTTQCLSSGSVSAVSLSQHLVSAGPMSCIIPSR